LRDRNNATLFHLVAAEFTGHCGLDYWAPMSRIIRAESVTGPAGPYIFAQEVAGTFAHNPTTLWDASTGAWTTFHIGCPYPQPQTCIAPHFQCAKGDAENGESGIYLLTSPDLRAWTSHGLILGGNDNVRAWDADTTNPSAAFITSANASKVVLAYRGCPNNCLGAELMGLAAAQRPLGPYTRLSTAPLFPAPGEGAEDPFIWQDRRGNFHMRESYRLLVKLCWRLFLLATRSLSSSVVMTVQ
jgi:hypothetical protein